MLKSILSIVISILRLFIVFPLKSIILSAKWSHSLRKVEKQVSSLNPHTATGKDLDNIGSIFDCERHFWNDFQIAETDEVYRYRILKAMGVTS